MIVDHHVHLGRDNKTGYSLNGKALFSKMDKYGIDRSVVFSCPNVVPLDCNPYIDGNSFVLDAASNNSRLIPFMFVHPHKDSLEYLESAASLFEGFKIYSSAEGMAYDYSSLESSEIFDFMSSSRKPLLAHTSLSGEGSAKSLVNLASYYNGPFLVAHAARLNLGDLELLSRHQNVHIDISPFSTMLENPNFLDKSYLKEECFSKLDPFAIVGYLYKLFEGRLIWGTDSPWCDELSEKGYGKEVELFRKLNIAASFKTLF